jgi:hypothetical protein
MANDKATKAPRAAASKAGAAKRTPKARAKATAAVKGASGSTKRTAPRTLGSRSTVELVGDYAERAVLIPVGVALTARDSVVSSVNEVITSYSSPARAQTQLRKFERRGSTARSRLEREVRKTRTRLERELRERRRELEKRREGVTKGFTTQVEQTQAQIEKTQSQIEGALRARLEDGADLANRVQERVLHLV